MHGSRFNHTIEVIVLYLRFLFADISRRKLATATAPNPTEYTQARIQPKCWKFVVFHNIHTKTTQIYTCNKTEKFVQLLAFFMRAYWLQRFFNGHCWNWKRKWENDKIDARKEII